MPPVPLPSYAIELIRAEVISIVPKRSRKSEIWRPPKIQLATMATTNATRIPRLIKILRTAAFFVATALCRRIWKSIDDASTQRGGYNPTPFFVEYNRSLVLRESRGVTRRFSARHRETRAGQIFLPVLFVHARAILESLTCRFCRRRPDQARRCNVRFRI